MFQAMEIKRTSLFKFYTNDLENVLEVEARKKKLKLKKKKKKL